MKRAVGAHEQLDGPLDDAAALRDNLRDLRRINALLGGVRLSAWGISRFASTDRALRVLDVGTGAADIPVAVRGAWHGLGPAPAFTATDSRPAVLTAARLLT